LTGTHTAEDLASGGAQLDHFADVSKMVCNRVLADFAGGFCFRNNGLEISPGVAAQQVLEVSASQYSTPISVCWA